MGVNQKKKIRYFLKKLGKIDFFPVLYLVYYKSIIRPWLAGISEVKTKHFD